MLESFFAPKSVAVIGASREPGKVGNAIVEKLLEGGFPGQIIPVNVSAGLVRGLPAYRTIADYDDPIDLAIIAVPAARVVEAATTAVRKRVKGIVVVSSGFRELSPEGGEYEEKLLDICKKGGVRLLGPNCLGLINTRERLNATFARGMAKAGSMAVFSQSGAMSTAIMDMAADRELGISKLVSIGNKADINEVEVLEAFAADEESDIIVGYLEDISEGDKFVEVAEIASQTKPVVILKAGTTSAGARAAAHHTGVLASADTAYGAAFKRAGICLADSFDALLDYTVALSLQPMPKGDRVVIITNAGGPGTLAADAVERAGLEVALLDPAVTVPLKASLPDAASVENPIDVLGDTDPERYTVALASALKDDSVDAVLVILTPLAMTKPADVARAITEGLDGSKPVLAVFMGGLDLMPGRRELAAGGLPCYLSPERAVAALKVMYDYGVWKRRPARHVVRFPVNRRRVERIITRSRRIDRLHVGEVKSKDILKAYGFHTLTGRLASTAEEAVEFARFIGFPVAMKAVSPHIIHKTDMGGVKLNVGSPREVEDAFDLMMLRIGKHAPQAQVEGIYVEKMAESGLEVIIGMTRDPQFGPMLMFGLGGIFVEVMKDVAFHLAPITEAEAVQMLMSTRSYELLQGKRGSKEFDIGAIAAALQRISQLATDFPEVIEVDINPLIVGEIGTDPVVADASMRFIPVR